MSCHITILSIENVNCIPQICMSILQYMWAAWVHTPFDFRLSNKIVHKYHNLKIVISFNSQSTVNLTAHCIFIHVTLIKHVNCTELVYCSLILHFYKPRCFEGTQMPCPWTNIKYTSVMNYYVASKIINLFLQVTL